MGFFSWKTSDKPRRSIANKHSSRPTFAVKMLDDKGNSWDEHDYDGYGVFGGKDYYELVAEMAGDSSDRGEGIKISFDNLPKKLPKLVRIGCTKTWAELPDSEICDDQGFFYNF